MYYQEILVLGFEEREKIEKHRLSKNLMGENDIISNTVKFGNGVTMEIRLCGSRYYYPWTEAILSKDSQEVCRTRPRGFYFDRWDMEYEGDVYSVIVDWEDE